MSEKNHYKTLGISPDADEKEIRAAHRSLAKKYHPDAGEGSSAEKFRDIQQSYGVLSDPAKRVAYDRERNRQSAPIREVETWDHSWAPVDFGPARSSHIDLRNLSSRGAGEPLRFTRGFERPREASSDPWSDLIAFLFDDFPF